MSLLGCWQLASLVAWTVWKELWQNVITLDFSFVVTLLVCILSLNCIKGNMHWLFGFLTQKVLMARINTAFPPALLVALVSLGAHCLVWSCACSGELLSLSGEQASPGRCLFRFWRPYACLRRWLQLRLKQALEQKYGQLVSHCILLFSMYHYVAARVVIHPPPSQWGNTQIPYVSRANGLLTILQISCGRYLQKKLFLLASEQEE